MRAANVGGRLVGLADNCLKGAIHCVKAGMVNQRLAQRCPLARNSNLRVSVVSISAIDGACFEHGAIKRAGVGLAGPCVDVVD